MRTARQIRIARIIACVCAVISVISAAYVITALIIR